MRKPLIRIALILSMLVVMTVSASSWIQTNWPAGNSYFSLYASQGKVFARIWDTYNGGRVFLTTDNGANWTLISSAEPDIDILSLVLVNSNILAGTWDGFYRSTDGGTTFTAFSPSGVPAGTALSALAMIDTTLFAGATGHIYKSADNGSTWTEVSSGITTDARILSFASSGSAIFAGSASNGVFKTTNGGTSWTAANSGLSDTHISQLAVLGTRLFAVTLTGVYISDNGGTSWTASSGLADINCLAVVNNQLYAGTDASGVYLSTDNGVSWTAVPSGMPDDTRVWSLAATSAYLFAGTDSGVWSIPVSTVTYTITASASAGGSISPSGDVTVYEHGSQTFTITPDTGFAVSDVLVDGASAGAVSSYTFSDVTANHTIAASFYAVPTYTITASAGAGGTISPSGAVLVSEGSAQTFTITPQTGYSIASLTVDGSAVPVAASYTFTNVTSNHTIAAAFSINIYTITATAGTGGTISPSGTVEVQYGGSQTFTISANSGYVITAVLVDGVSVGAVTSYTFSAVAANHTISASFSLPATYRINSGGSAASPFTADQYYSGGTARTVTNNIDTSGVTDPAPQAVYKSERYGTTTYTFPSLSAGASYTVRLHFAELYWTATGSRRFNVAINGTTVLSNYDIYAVTGARYKAVVREFAATANSSGQIVIVFTTVTDNATIEGIEIIPAVVNAAPTIATPAAATPNPVPGTTTALSVLGADDGGEANLTYTWATSGTPPAAVTFSPNGTNAAKNSTATFSKAGDYTFQVTVKDAGNLTATSAVNVTVNQTLTSIVVSPASATVYTSATQQFSASARDQFATTLTTQPAFGWSVSGGGTIDANGLFTAGTTPGGPYTVTAESGAVSGTAGVTVARINHAPVADAQSVAAAEDTAVAITLTGSDEDLDPLTFAVQTPPAHGTLSGSAPNLTYTPAANYNGSDSFTFVVNDGQVSSAAATVSITISPVNDAPVANAQAVTTAEDSAVAITLSGSDVDGDALTFAVQTGPAHGTLSGTAPNLTYTPASNQNGGDSFTFTVNDGQVDSAPATVSITITPVNDAPVADAQAVTTAEDTAVAITLSGSDVDGDTLSFSIQTQPGHGTLSGSGANRSYTPAANYNGADSFTFVVNDGSVNSAAATVNITVTPVNDAPVANAQSVTTQQDTAVAVTLTGSDVDGDALTFNVVTAPGHGTLSGTAPSLTYTPATGYSGADSFTFAVNDGALDSAEATVSITVSAAGDTVYLSLAENSTLTGLGTVNDEDIVALNLGSGVYSWVFDGSDVGITGDIDAIDVLPNGHILMSFDASTSVTGIGTVADADIVEFTPTSLGATTAGTFTWKFDGSDVGLSSNTEDIDSLYMMNDGTMLISTVDAFSVTGASGQDEDIIRFTATSWGSTTAGSWSWYFDGSDVGLSTNANEDVDALWVDQTMTPYPYLYLSTLGDFSVTGVSGANEDAFVFMPTALGATSAGTFQSTLYLDGSLFGLSSYNVDAFDVQR